MEDPFGDEDSLYSYESDFTENEEDEFSLCDEAIPLQANNHLRRRKKSKKGLKIPLVNCHQCKRPYFSLDNYIKHLRVHAVEDLFKNAPGFLAVRDECRSVYNIILADMLTLKPTCGITADIRGIAEELQALSRDMMLKLVDYAAEEMWTLIPPISARPIRNFHSSYVKATPLLLANSDKRETFLQIIKELLVSCNVGDSVLQWFVTDFLKKLSTKVEVFYLKCLREPYEVLLCEDEVEEGNLHNRDNLDNVDFQQSVHYGGGSAVRSVLRKATMSLGSPPWSAIYDCVCNRFLINEEMAGPGEKIEAWTKSKDRGGLKHINANVWCFCMALSGVLKRMEGNDGSILHEDVFTAICEDDILMLMWSNVVGNVLKEDDSVLLLKNFCKLFVSTWGHGVALRRKNAISKLSRDKMPLRSRLST